MSANITLLPSGHEFQVEHGETVLDAALRMGLSISCSCTNGTCGKCMARIVSGQPSRVLHHDFILREADRQAGAILLCRALADTDMVLEVKETSRPEDIAEQSISTSVSKIEFPSDDVLVLNLRTPRSNTLQFLAGQHARLLIEGAPVRNKSIASCPCNGMVLQFHIHRVPGDEFSGYLFDNIRPRQAITVEGPYGNFLLDETSRRPIIFIAYETGFAPIKSLIEHAIALEFTQSMRLYWVAGRREDHYLDNYCRALQDAMDDFHYHPVVTPGDDIDTAMAGLADEIVKSYPDLSAWDVYINGPLSNMATLQARLLEAGLPQERLFSDLMARF